MLRWAVRSKSAALMITLIAASCAREVQPPTPSASPPRPIQKRPAPAPAIPSTTAYFAEAAAIDLFEIRASELALERSSSAGVREFAAMMIAAHKGTSAQLSFAGRRLNLLPSATLDAKRQAMLDSLQSAANFHALYRRQQLAIHQEALTLHRDYAARGTSPTLRTVAAAMVPIVERHLRLIRYL